MRKIRNAVLALSIATATIAVQAQPASATTLLTCAGNYSITYNPGLTNTPQTVSFTAQTSYTLCLPALGLTGTATAAATLPSIACSQLLNPPNAGTTTINWNTGESSKYTWTSTAAAVAGAIVTTTNGTITEGKFVGSTIERITISPNIQTLQNACNRAGGLTQENGTASLTIVGI